MLAAHEMMRPVEVDRLADSVAARLRDVPFTYVAVGGSAGSGPLGFWMLRRSRILPRGTDFETATRALMTWQLHTNAGLRVKASSDVVAKGVVVLLGFGVGRFRLSAPCRVVYTIDEERRRGFAYGTLPGHPESGEERFLIEKDRDGRVALTISAFSRPNTTLVKLMGPVARWTQGRMTERYLHALDS